MSCSMDLLNWAEDCYTQEEAKNSRPLCFDLINEVFTEVGYLKEIQQNKQKYNKVLEFFKEGLISNLPDTWAEGEERLFVHDGGNNIDTMWEGYKESEPDYATHGWGAEDFNPETAEDICQKSFVMFWIGCFNLNLLGHWDESVYDRRYENNWCRYGLEEPIAWEYVLNY